MNGAEIALSSLLEEGTRYIFGLPGTSEIPLMAAIQKAPVKFFLCLHETVAVGMADGFSRAANWGLSIACTHASQGTLNAAGYLRASLRDHVPTILLAGSPGTGYVLHEPNHHLTGLTDALSAMTKWTWQAQSSDQIPQMIHRGVTLARTGTRGPVAMLIPQDFLEAETRAVVLTRVWDKIVDDGNPSSAVVRRLRSLVADATNPIVLAGNSAIGSDFLEVLAEFSARFSIPVVGESVDRGPMVQPYVLQPDHPNFLGFFSRRNRLIINALKSSDLIITIGMKTDYRRVMGAWIHSARIIQIDRSAWEIGKNHDVIFGIVGDPASVLRSLMDGWYPGTKLLRAERATRLLDDSSPTVENGPTSTLLPGEAADIVIDGLARDNILIDDSQSFGGYLKTRMSSTSLNGVFGSLASHLGWGLPAALGVQLAKPDQRAVAVVSDGSFMASFQALWTAVRYEIPVLVILINNGGFASLSREMGAHRPSGNTNDFASLQISGMSPDYVSIARGLGVNGITIKTRQELIEGFRGNHNLTAPFLLDLRMTQDQSEWSEGWYVPPTSTL